MAFLGTFVGVLAFTLWILVFGRVMLSWFDPTGSSQAGRFLFQATEPFLAPIRRLLPPSGMIDFSGLIVLVVLGLVWRVLL